VKCDGFRGVEIKGFLGAGVKWGSVGGGGVHEQREFC